MPRQRAPELRDPTKAYVRVPTRIWQDPVMRSLTVNASHLYLRGMFQLTHQGHSDYLPRTWVADQLPRPGQRRRAVQELLSVNWWSATRPGYVITNWMGIEINLGLTRSSIPDSVRNAIYARDGHRCLHCGTTEHLSLDHITPWSAGGSDHPSNLQTLCRSCNSRKGTRRPTTPHLQEA